MEFKKDFGKRIKYLRNKANFTQEKLAEIVGIDTKHVSHIETGRSFPKADLIDKFANAFGVNCEELFSFAKEKDRELMIKEINETIQETDDN